MNIILNPKLEAFIQQQIHSGKYDSINSVIEEALNLLEKRNQYDNWVEDIRQKVDIAAVQLDKGEGIDGETAISQLREKLRQSCLE